jgi:hypothetical protein
MKQKQIEKDYGKSLFDALMFMISLLAVLWFFKV